MAAHVIMVMMDAVIGLDVLEGAIVPRHSIPWDVVARPPKFTADRWELYNTNEDFSQSQDLAAKYPDKLKELQRLFLAEAEKYNVLPPDDRRVERFVPTLAGRFR
jgi:hypothetical protein